MTDRSARPRGRPVLLALLCVGLAVVATSGALHELLLEILVAASAVIAANPIRGAILFVLLSAVSAMVAFFSTAILVPVAVYAWNETVTFGLLWVGWILGGVLAYGVGRFLGRKVVAALSSGRALAYGDRISKEAGFGLVLLFQLGLPSEIPGYALGLLRYSLVKYLAALSIAELPYAVATVYLGVSFLQGQTLVLAGLGAAVVLFAAWAFHILHRRLAAAGRDERG